MGREQQTGYQKEQGNDTNRRNCIYPARPEREDKGNEVQEPDRFTQRGNRIDQVDPNEDRGSNHYDADI